MDVSVSMGYKFLNTLSKADAALLLKRGNAEVEVNYGGLNENTGKYEIWYFIHYTKTVKKLYRISLDKQPSAYSLHKEVINNIKLQVSGIGVIFIKDS
jgi:hypothetical protein